MDLPTELPNIRREYVCSISRSPTEDTFVIYELWGKGGKADSGWGQGTYMWPALLLEARTSGRCYRQQSSGRKRRFLCEHGVAAEAAEPASGGRRGWLMNVLVCLLKVDSVILARNRSPWSNSPRPLRNKGQSFYHRVLKRNSKSSWKRLWENILWFLQTFVDSLPVLKSGNTSFRENTSSLPGWIL